MRALPAETSICIYELAAGEGQSNSNTHPAVRALHVKEDKRGLAIFQNEAAMAVFP